MRLRRMLSFGVLLAVLVVIGACSDNGGDDAVEETAPTDAPPTATNLPAEQEVDGSTTTPVPPTPTPLRRMTLPPSWTPTQAPSNTPTYTPTLTSTPEPTQLIRPPDTPRPACANFRVNFDQSTREFELGEAPTVSWQSIEGAELYRLYVFDQREFERHMQLVEGSSYTIPADVFNQEGVYGWTVEPLDNVGIQMCTEAGSELVVRD